MLLPLYIIPPVVISCQICYTYCMDKLCSLDQIKNRLTDVFGDNVLSAIVYGSTLGDDYCDFSDFDILLIFEKVEFKIFEQLRTIKKDFAEQNVYIDFNIHSLHELPKSRKEVFWHNNRGIYVQKELALYGKVLFGKKYFDDLELDHQNIMEEAVKVISSLNYQVRKTLTNKDLNTTNRVIMIKWCIYGVIYVLAAQNCFPSGRREALRVFNERFYPRINPEKFLDIKVGRPDKITMDDIEQAFEFLTYLDELIFRLYKKERDARV